MTLPSHTSHIFQKESSIRQWPFPSSECNQITRPGVNASQDSVNQTCRHTVLSLWCVSFLATEHSQYPSSVFYFFLNRGWWLQDEQRIRFWLKSETWRSTWGSEKHVCYLFTIKKKKKKNTPNVEIVCSSSITTPLTLVHHIGTWLAVRLGNQCQRGGKETDPWVSQEDGWWSCRALYYRMFLYELAVSFSLKPKSGDCILRFP